MHCSLAGRATRLMRLRFLNDKITLKHRQEIMKFRLLLTLGGLAIGFGAQARAQEQNTVDPQVRQQIEALNQKFDEAFNQNDAEAVADLFTAGAVEAGPDEAAASGQQEIEDRYKVLFESHPSRHTSKLDQVCAIGRPCLCDHGMEHDAKNAFHPAYAPQRRLCRRD